jgi:DNA-binding CsgD family transcriptional regulator
MIYEDHSQESFCSSCTSSQSTSASSKRTPSFGGEYTPGLTRMIKTEDLASFNQLVGEAVILRDESLRISWCNDAYMRMCDGYTRNQIIGSRMGDFISPIAAEEREDALRAVMDSEQPAAHIHFCGDIRLLNVVIPIDEESFGNRGVLILLKNAPIGPELGLAEPLPMISTPCLDSLDALSARELEVFYYIATGQSNAEIAESLFRAVKTVENHVASIHRKLQTTNRSKLVRYGVERGIHAFTPEQWKILIDGAMRIRKDSI